jgi:hypothetical protein
MTDPLFARSIEPGRSSTARMAGTSSVLPAMTSARSWTRLANARAAEGYASTNASISLPVLVDELMSSFCSVSGVTLIAAGAAAELTVARRTTVATGSNTPMSAHNPKSASATRGSAHCPIKVLIVSITRGPSSTDLPLRVPCSRSACWPSFVMTDEARCGLKKRAQGVVRSSV